MLDTFMSSILGTKLPHNNPYLISTISLANIGLFLQHPRLCTIHPLILMDKQAISHTAEGIFPSNTPPASNYHRSYPPSINSSKTHASYIQPSRSSTNTPTYSPPLQYKIDNFSSWPSQEMNQRIHQQHLDTIVMGANQVPRWHILHYLTHYI